MKTIFALTIIFLGFSTAQATPAHPCAPVVQARPIIISCSENGLYYGIRIHTRMSDSRFCPNQDHVEIQTAKIIVSDFDGNIQKEITIGNRQFTFTLSPIGDATFTSERESLDLKNCSFPMPGGFSVGN